MNAATMRASTIAASVTVSKKGRFVGFAMALAVAAALWLLVAAILS